MSLCFRLRLFGLRSGIAGLLLNSLTPGLVYGQMQRGALQGVISGLSGGVVPGASAGVSAPIFPRGVAAVTGPRGPLLQMLRYPEPAVRGLPGAAHLRLGLRLVF